MPRVLPPVTPYNGRIFIILLEADDESAFPHGVVACPPQITDHTIGWKEIRRIYEQTRSQFGDSWTYDEFFDGLEAGGFDVIPAAYWVE